MEDEKIVKMPELNYDPDPRGLGYVYYESMLKYKDKVAQIEGLTGKTDTFGDLLERSVRTALNLQERGLRPGEMVTACTNHHLNSGIPLIASMFVGATVSHLEPSMSLNETIFLLKQVMPKIMFVEQEWLENIQKALRAIDSDAEVIVFGVDDVLPPNPKEEHFAPHPVETLSQTAVVVFSSGTTGYPKGICLSHRSILCQMVNKTEGLKTEFDLMASYATPYWPASMCLQTLSITKCITRLVYPKFVQERAWEMFDYQVTVAFINAAQASLMIRQGKAADLNDDALNDLLIFGDVLSEEKVLKMRDMFPNARVHLIYGQTEIPMATTIFDVCNERDLELMRGKPNSVGTGLYGMAYKIVEVDTSAVLGPNQRGELRVKTQFQTSGYLGRDSSGIWDADGWMKTGDLAYYDQDRCFYIVGRVKEMFKFREWHIIPTVLEDILATHKAVESVAVIGVPHEMDGHRPMALVVLKESYQNTKADDIDSFLVGKINDRQRLRGGIRFVSKLPLTATGKIDRKKLRELYT